MSEISRDRVSLWGVAFVSFGGACGDPVPAVVDAGNPPRVFLPLRCANADDAPLPSGGEPQGVTCVAVGAHPAGPGDEWPAAPAGAPFAPPIRFVSPGGAADADGTSADRPARDLVRVVDALGAGGGTVLLSRGTHLVAVAVHVRGPLTVVGVGAGGGSIVSASTTQRSAMVVDAPARLTVRHVGYSLPSGSTPGADPDAEPGMITVAAGARADLEDVAVTGAAVGVRVDGGELRALRVTVRDASNDGLVVRAGGRAVLARLLVRNAQRRGVFVDASHLFLSESHVVGSGSAGVAILGSAAANTGATACPFAEATGRGGALDCLDRVAIYGSASAGIYLSGPTASGAGPSVEARLLSIASTRPLGDGPSAGGDGVYVGTRATLRVDPGLTGAAAMGRGTAIIGNARSGVLVSGGTVRLSGAFIASNQGPGVFLQLSAVAEEIGYCALPSNTGLGIGATPSTRVDAITCNGIAQTRLSNLATNLGVLRVGDAISVAGEAGATGSISVTENIVDDSGRFAIILSGGIRARVSGNEGENNRFGLQTYDGALLEVDSDNGRLRAREPAPTTNPGVASGTP